MHDLWKLDFWSCNVSGAIFVKAMFVGAMCVIAMYVNQKTTIEGSAVHKFSGSVFGAHFELPELLASFAFGQNYKLLRLLFCLSGAEGGGRRGGEQEIVFSLKGTYWGTGFIPA